MLTALADWQRASLRPWLTLSRVAWTPFAGPLTAFTDLALINLGVGEPAERDLRAAVERDAGQPVVAAMLEDHPFAAVRALHLEGVRADRRILLAAPYSGYATTVLSGLIAALIGDAEVIVTDWRDARLVPVAAGSMDLAGQIDLLERLMRAAGPASHVVALSQAAVPALLATAALAAAAPGAAPASLSLLGGPIDPRANPTPANHLLLGALPDALEATWFRTVDQRYPGAGRVVLPSLHHLLLFALAHPEPYLNAQFGALFELAGGEGSGLLRSLDDLHALIDVPAELVLQVLRDVFHTPVLFDGGFRLGSRWLDPEAITESALLTIEAANDALVGRGQTHAAHGLTSALPDARRGRLTLAGAAHYDLFTGPVMTGQVAPALRGFMAAFDR